MHSPFVIFNEPHYLWKNSPKFAQNDNHSHSYIIVSRPNLAWHLLFYLQDIIESSIANSTPWILLLWSQKISCNLRKRYFFTGQTQGCCYILLHVWKFVNYPTPGSFGEETITRSKGHLWFSHVKKVLLFALELYTYTVTYL